MDTDLFHAGRDLAKGRLFRIHDGQGQRVECLSGCLWLTQESDQRDVVLEAGGGFTIDHAGDTFLSALADSRFVVLAELSNATASNKPAERAAAGY